MGDQESEHPRELLAGAAERSEEKQRRWAAADEIGAEDWWVLQAQNMPVNSAATYMRRDGYPTTRVVDEVEWFKIQAGAESMKQNLFGLEWKAVRIHFTGPQVRAHKESAHT